MRGEINYCMQCILMTRNILSALWCLEKGHLPNDIGDWSRYEGARSVLSQAQPAMDAEGDFAGQAVGPSFLFGCQSTNQTGFGTFWL